MCETVEQYFDSIHIARNIRDGIEYVNKSAREYVFRDHQWDSENEWRERGVWDVCCLTKLVECDGDGMFGCLDYDMNHDDDVNIPEVALRIATEKGWVRV